MVFHDGAHGVDFFVSMFDPSLGAEGPMISRSEMVAGFDVSVKEAAVIDDASDEIDIVFFGGGEAESGGPGFKGVEDDHGPVDIVAEFFVALDDVEGEAVGGSRSDSECFGCVLLFERAEAVPYGF